MTLAARITSDMVPQMSTIELRLAVKQLSGADVTTRNTPALRSRVLRLLSQRDTGVPIEARADAAPATALAMSGDAATTPAASIKAVAAAVAPKRAKAKPVAKAMPIKGKLAFAHDHRLLAIYRVGDVIEKRDGKGKLIAGVTVERDGFSWHGKRYESLTPIATEVTGTAQSGLVYFGVIPYNDRDRKGKTTADIAPAFDAALGVFNLVAKGLGLDELRLGGLAELEQHDNHQAVREGIARLRSYATQMRAQLQALALGENLLEVRHGRAPEAVR